MKNYLFPLFTVALSLVISGCSENVDSVVKKDIVLDIKTQKFNNEYLYDYRKKYSDLSSSEVEALIDKWEQEGIYKEMNAQMNEFNSEKGGTSWMSHWDMLGFKSVENRNQQIPDINIFLARIHAGCIHSGGNEEYAKDKISLEKSAFELKWKWMLISDRLISPQTDFFQVEPAVKYLVSTRENRKLWIGSSVDEMFIGANITLKQSIIGLTQASLSNFGCYVDENRNEIPDSDITGEALNIESPSQEQCNSALEYSSKNLLSSSVDNYQKAFAKKCSSAGELKPKTI